MCRHSCSSIGYDAPCIAPRHHRPSPLPFAFPRHSQTTDTISSIEGHETGSKHDPCMLGKTDRTNGSHWVPLRSCESHFRASFTVPHASFVTRRSSVAVNRHPQTASHSPSHHARHDGIDHQTPAPLWHLTRRQNQKGAGVFVPPRTRAQRSDTRARHRTERSSVSKLRARNANPCLARMPPVSMGSVPANPLTSTAALSTSLSQTGLGALMTSEKMNPRRLTSLTHPASGGLRK
jgi:hypothetical protein